jgi:hypothetical protein
MDSIECYQSPYPHASSSTDASHAPPLFQHRLTECPRSSAATFWHQFGSVDRQTTLWKLPPLLTLRLMHLEVLPVTHFLSSRCFPYLFHLIESASNKCEADIFLVWMNIANDYRISVDIGYGTMAKTIG